MDGWISLHRKIRCHPFYKERRKFSKFEAWIDMLLEANHADNSWIAGNEVVLIRRGFFITSEVKLMERWQWSKSKVRAFLKLLESEQMIVKITDTKKTTINIINYDNYQRNETTKEPEKDCKKTAKRPQKDTNNNVNKDNKKEYAPEVNLTETEYQKLIEEYGECNTTDRIERLSLYKQSSGRKYKSDYATILTWARGEAAKGKGRELPIPE